MRIKELCGIALAMATLLSVSRSGRAQTGETTELFKRLESRNSVERQAASRSILEQRAETIREVQAIIRKHLGDKDTAGQEIAKSAILVLGNLRSVESVPFLVEHLTFEPEYRLARPPEPIKTRVPAVAALIQVGLLSVVPVLERYETDEQDLKFHAAALVEGVLGKKLGLRYVQARLEEEVDATRRERLTRLCDYIQSRPRRRKAEGGRHKRVTNENESLKQPALAV